MKVRHVRLAVFVLLLVGASVARAETPLRRWYGTRIASLSFRGDGPIDERYARRIVTLRPGEALTEVAVRESIRNLFATQWFSDLWIDVIPAAEGTDVAIAYSAAPRIASLSVEGPGIPSRGSLYDALGIARGDFWDRERGRAAEEAVTRFLRERGFFEATTRTEVELAPDGASVEVRFVVAVGPEAETAPPLFQGDLGPVTVAELVKAARLKPGKPYGQVAARRDAETFSELYHRKGFARAEVRFEADRYEPSRRQVTTSYAIFVGPRLVLSVDGASEREIRNHPGAPWAKGTPPDEESIRKFADLLRREYQEKGHARAIVQVSFAASESEERVSFRIRPGDRYAVSEVTVEGNVSIPSRELLALLGTRPRGALSSGRLVDSVMVSDRATIESMYRSRGFSNAKVGEAAVRDDSAPYTLSVAFPIDEGVQLVVGSRVVEGTVALRTADVEKLLSVRTGQPFRPSDVDGDVATIRSLLADRGFIQSHVDAALTRLEGTPDEPARVAVKYVVFEGSEFQFGKTIVRGNRVTRISEIEREFTYKEGDALSFGRLAETEQRLARLGIFQRLDMTTLPATPGSSKVPLLLTVSETKPWSLLYGLGAEYDTATDRRLNPRLSLGVSYYNLFGGAITASFEARYSVRESRILATLRKRSLFGTLGPVSLTTFRADQTQPTFRVFRLGTFLEVEKKLSEKSRATFRYQYEVVRPTADDPSILSTLERQDQQISISSLGTAIIRDTRDDPAAPKTGWFLLADSKWAFAALGAEAKFLKVQGQAARFLPLGRSVVAVSLRAGAIASFGTCDPVATPGCPPNLEIPIVERFFAGGRTTHRAFPLDNLGIEGQTLKNGSGIGGNALLMANLEWRVPVYGNLGLTVLFDAGNVWADPGRVRVGDVRYGTGLGLSFMTPIGPIRLEYGYKLDRKPGEDAGAFNFSIGYPF
jgi:outer membrane protein insertion porin family